MLFYNYGTVIKLKNLSLFTTLGTESLIFFLDVLSYIKTINEGRGFKSSFNDGR